tara:strand:+ start:340 stop:951 length:612 start_codon:yes stop_codon:yes gene_type:complete
MSKLKVDEIRSADRSVSSTANITLADDGNTSLGGTLSAGTLGSSVVFPTGKFIPLKGITHSDGSTSASGNNVDMLSISVNLTNYQNYILFAWAHTAISENDNNSNTSILRIRLHNSSTYKSFASQRQGMGVYSPMDSNYITHLSCQGYYVIESAYATSCTLKMNGGINNSSGGFSWGDQSSYSNFDGETPNAGGTLGFMLFHP